MYAVVGIRIFVLFFKPNTSSEMRISDWSSDVCSSDLFPRLLAEPFIKGRELTVAVLGDHALGVTELRVKSGFYDYDAKYTEGLTEHVCPAEVPDDIAQRMKDLAVEAHRMLGCKGTSRSDFRWADEHGLAGIFMLEVKNHDRKNTRLNSSH